MASCQRCQNHPTVKDLKATNKAVGVAKAHKDAAWVLRRVGESNLAICVYHDAAWADVPDDAATRSTRPGWVDTKWRLSSATWSWPWGSRL